MRCFVSVVRQSEQANSKISAAANAVKFKSQLPKVSFGKACIKSFVLENAEGKGKCRSIYALIFLKVNSRM